MNIYDVGSMQELANRLLYKYEDEKFYGEVVKHAMNELPFYDAGNTIRRFSSAVQDAIQIKNERKARVSVQQEVST